MEDTVNEHAQDGEAILAAALNPGEVIVPQRLLDAVESLSSPLDFMASIEPAAEPFDAFHEEYPAMHLRRCGARSLTPDETEQAAGLLRWMLGELMAWTRKNDPRLEKVAAMMVLLNELAWNDVLWSILPDTAVNPDLVKLLSDILKNYRIEIQGEPGSRSSRTTDLVSELVKADEEEDWVAISGRWQQIEPWLTGGGILGCALPCLARFDMSALGSAMNEVSQIQMAYFVAGALSETNRLRLARVTTSRRYRFAAVLSISWGKHAFKSLGDDAETELVALLEEVSQDVDQWPRWMRAFNEYPLRFPALQRSLGRALAQAPDHGLTSYVDSISLTAWSFNGFRYGHPSRLDGRQSVALCLGAFREAASPEKRLKLWRLAHTRWTLWAFGRQSSSQHHVTGIVGSELDYAISAHAAECLTSDEREIHLTLLAKDVHDLEMTWHASLSELISGRYILLSMLQPLLAASASEWLFEQPVLPVGLAGNSYTKQKFEV